MAARSISKSNAVPDKRKKPSLLNKTKSVSTAKAKVVLDKTKVDKTKDDTKDKTKDETKERTKEDSKDKTEVDPKDIKKTDENFVAWSKRVHNMNCKELSREFNDKIKKYIASDVTTAECQKAVNVDKCRYADVKCVDQTRVVLKGKKSPDDFIHANWVKSPGGGTSYICTQGPLQETQNDFWWMCLKEKVSIIVMLCDFTEGDDCEKCAKYFPAELNKPAKYGEVTVTMTKKGDDITVDQTDFFTFEVKHKSETITVKHCYTRYWIDNCAPIETEPILKLWRWVRKHHANRPVVVHCSAGVGRTATFVGIEFAQYRVGINPSISLLDVVKELRQQRYQSVQSHVQFLYIHYLLLDYLVQEKIVPAYTKSKFVDDYRKHTAKRITKMKARAASKTNKDSKELENDMTY